MVPLLSFPFLSSVPTRLLSWPFSWLENKCLSLLAWCFILKLFTFHLSSSSSSFIFLVASDTTHQFLPPFWNNFIIFKALLTPSFFSWFPGHPFHSPLQVCSVLLFQACKWPGALFPKLNLPPSPPLCLCFLSDLIVHVSKNHE